MPGRSRTVSSRPTPGHGRSAAGQRESCYLDAAVRDRDMSSARYSAHSPKPWWSIFASQAVIMAAVADRS